ncbi:hypothetical protein QO002_005141 [Pararhizobium capsulatum DSM 1112]|uniref:Uncharacterized protein n=1 Tax=Pararhizobium capsulatum DSM 1112 TaxID=1121113 RepID=A0ABU0BXD8_9HYPH|nr:hypothetical protein [Pararhizobium capsulatum]MDQ0322935.1 hypothetical protein [Pararhizobium capsulatum DSM 1112]
MQAEDKQPDRDGQSDKHPNNDRSIVERMLEEMSYQTDLLGHVLAEQQRANCQLEQIARQTCEAQNELHRQTAFQGGLLKLLSYQVDLARTLHPGIAQLLDCKYGIDRCLDIGCCDGEPPPCKHVRCSDDKGLEEGSEESKPGQVKPRKVKDAPYPPVKREDNPNRQPNTRPQRKVPDGPFRGILRRSHGSNLRDIRSGNPGGAGIDFPVWTDDSSVANASANAADISGAKSGNVVLLSGNWYIDYSTDSGTTFTTLNPTTIFPQTLVGGFCCDQILQYAPQIDRFLWLLQYQSDATGANAYRLAAASPQDVINSNCTAWTYWDLTSGSFGLGTHWMDYPNMSLGDGEVYFSFDVLDTVADTIADNGLVVVRLSLAEIAAGGTINFRYTTAAESAVAWGSGVSQNTGNEVFWAGHVDNSTTRVFSWRNDSTTYFWRDVEVSNWPNGTLSSNGPNGNNWFGWGFPNNAVIGITRRLNELWLGWTASNGKGSSAGFNFPHPHVQIVKLNIADWKVIEQMQVWNPDLAFGYPSLATNSDNEVGIILGWGGGGSFNANTAVGFMGDYVVWYRNGSTWTHTRFGDYVTVRRAAPESQMFAGFGFVTVDTTTPAGASHRFDPYYVLFGREKNEPRPPR